MEDKCGCGLDKGQSLTLYRRVPPIIPRYNHYIEVVFPQFFENGLFYHFHFVVTFRVIRDQLLQGDFVTSMKLVQVMIQYRP